MADESPLDRFKSVLTGASRAIAHEPEVEVAWTADAAVANGKNFRVPMPGRNLPRAQAMEARGFADAMALKLKHHDEALHARHAPSEPSARACYDAVEAVRYEALGANAYAGMRENLDAATMVRLGGDPITRASRPDEVPLQAALGLLLREHLTGQPVPEAARKGTDMLRGWIEERAGTDFDALALSLDDQKAFQALSLDMLQHLELTRDIASTFNHRYGQDFFTLPEPMIMGSATRVMSLRDGTKKMSKSAESDLSRINLTDDADMIMDKIKRAKTDPEPLPETMDELKARPEANNLVGIYAALDGRTSEAVLAEFAGQGFGSFKPNRHEFLN